MLPRREGRGLARWRGEGEEWNGGGTKGKREREREDVREQEREIGRRWGGDLSEVKSWKCSMAVGNR